MKNWTFSLLMSWSLTSGCGRSGERPGDSPAAPPDVPNPGVVVADRVDGAPSPGKMPASLGSPRVPEVPGGAAPPAPEPAVPWVELDEGGATPHQLSCKDDRCVVTGITRAVKDQLERLPNHRSRWIVFDAATTPQGFASVTNLPWVTRLDISFIQIEDLFAIGHLRALEELQAGGVWSQSLHGKKRVLDLGALSGLERLKTLELSESNLKNVAALGKCRSLKTLMLSRTGVTELDFLASLDQLEVLSLGGCPVRDLAPLSRLTSLRWLLLDVSRASSLAPLASLEKLEELILFNGSRLDLASLSSLKKLKALHLDSCQPEPRNMAAVCGLPQLENLSLVATPFSDTKALSGCVRLRELTIHRLERSSAKSGTLDPLTKLPRLEKLTIGPAVPKAELERLGKSLPNLKIVTR